MKKSTLSIKNLHIDPVIREANDSSDDNWFDLDFNTLEESENEAVTEKDLYDKLIQDGFIFTDKPD